ncbi:hypothetical protein PQJ75_29555 [Rhodoplanes sp. TEM]|uniref:DUF2059 domain-containing protein n=1 Tax=Rhodoplanes tepidamans TaxID=200616 RepID=A0ABT5JEG8_RHOTP|nr:MULTISPECIES: hypothetical protein [Rhodoplanes]MDC7788021.1 hypothetical protein [Rhodoplanes tepidamans]MDC7987900.1 hypothetical protein [Rhodoplanes sp. TEM]MDQ0353990.1 hypothetical protein [Rhodoplanes tepidamans]
MARANPFVRPRPRSLARAAAIGLLVLAVLAAAPVAAQIDPGKLAAAQAATLRFLTLARGSETTGRMPRESDPTVRQLLDTVFDTRDVRGPISFQELAPLSQRMVTGARIGTAYMLAGTGAPDLPALAKDPQADAKVNRNVVRFAPEMGRFLDFELRIQGAIVEAVLVQLAGMRAEEAARPNVQAGIASIRQGSLRTVASVIETLAVDGLSDDWRRARLPALAAIAPRLARFLEPAQRAELGRLAAACADAMTDPGLKRSLAAFGRTVDGT